MFTCIFSFLIAFQQTDFNKESIIKKIDNLPNKNAHAFSANFEVHLNFAGKINTDTGIFISSPCGCQKVLKNSTGSEIVHCGDTAWLREKNGSVTMYTEADEYQILTGKLLPVDVRTLIDTGSQIEMKNGSLLIDTKKMVDEKFTHIKLEIDTTEWLLREVTMFIGLDDPFRIIYQYTTFEKQPVYKSITIIMGAMGVQTYNFSKYRKIHDPRRKFFQLK